MLDGSHSRLLLGLIVLSALAAGCAKPKTIDHGNVFFPPPPDAPRIQYLTGIEDSTDIEGKNSRFSLVVTGSSEGNLIKKIGKANGIAAHRGKLYISSTGWGQIAIIDIANKTFEFLKGNHGAGKLQKPISTAIDDDGVLYVADTGRGDIAVFDPQGNYRKSFRIPEENSRIVGVAIYAGKLYALDNRASLIRVLDRRSGRELFTFGQAEEDPLNKIALPFAMTIDDQGGVYVTNIASNRVLKFDADGNFLAGFGRIGTRPGQFARPRGVSVLGEEVYVVDGGHQIVQVFNDEGRILGFFGNPGLPAGSLNLPSGVAVTRDNLDYFQSLAAPGFKLQSVIFVVNQLSSPINQAISVYGRGEMQEAN